MLNTTVKVLLAISLLATAGHIYAAEDSPSRVTMETSMGTIVIELDPRRAPTTTENFLRYVQFERLTTGVAPGERDQRALADRRREGVECVPGRVDPRWRQDSPHGEKEPAC